MSDLNTKQRCSFFDLYSRGEATAEAIDDWVGRWHDGLDPAAIGQELSDYLGLTEAEYQIWVYDADALPYLLQARRAGRSVEDLVQERLAEMVASGRPEYRTTVRGFRAWLDMRTRAQPTAV